MAIFNPGSGFGTDPDPSNWSTAQAALAAMREAAGGASLMLWPEAGQIGAYVAPLNGDPVIYEKLTELATDFARASKAWHQNWDFVHGSRPGSLVEFANNQPVIGPGGLLVSFSVENLLPNPRGEGSVGAVPTNWLASGGTGGTMTVIGRGTQDGWPYVDFQLDGTISPVGYIFMHPNAISAAAGDVTTAAVGLAHLSGTIGGQVDLRIYVNGPSLQKTVNLPLDRHHRRWWTSHTLTGSVTHAWPAITFAPGTYSNAVFRVFAPAMMKGSTQQPLILVLPPVGTPGASLKAAEFLNIPADGWYLHSAGTLLVEFIQPPIFLDSSFVMAGLTNADNTQYRAIRLSSSTGRISGAVFDGSSAAQNLNSAALGPGSRGLVALTWSGDGARGAVNGEVTAAFGAGKTPAAATRLVLGASQARIMRLRYFPYAVDADGLAEITTPYWS